MGEIYTVTTNQLEALLVNKKNLIKIAAAGKGKKEEKVENKKAQGDLINEINKIQEGFKNNSDDKFNDVLINNLESIGDGLTERQKVKLEADKAKAESNAKMLAGQEKTFCSYRSKK